MDDQNQTKSNELAKTTFNVNQQDLQVSMERVFEASPEELWTMLSDPTLIPKWWGPKQFITTVDKMDFRVGGEWRFVHKNAQGEFGFHGLYKEIDPAHKISDTFNFEGIPAGHEMLETMTLADLGNGQTKVRTISQFANIEDLEGMVNSGMEGGAIETWERLAELVENK